MLQEILLSLLGFAGDIIIDVGYTFMVADDFELLIAAEREQINRIVQLGWYYTALTRFIEEHEVQWDVQRCSPDGFQVYKAAMALAIGDLLSEYTEDITRLEQQIIAEGPIPISYLNQFMQKYLFSFPAINGICVDIESKFIRGCQILDYLASYRSGSPIVTDITNRMLLRVRTVFLKQTLAWMLHGSLQDYGKEFFIQTKTKYSYTNTNNSNNIQENNIFADVSKRFVTAFESNNIESESSRDHTNNNTTITSTTGSNFSWTSSYALRFEFLPETHVAPRTATKVLFAGKANGRLKSFDFKSSSSLSLSSDMNINANIDDDRIKDKDMKNEIKQITLLNILNNDNNGNGNDAGTSDQYATNALAIHFQSCGYEMDDIIRFNKKFEEIVQNPELTIELFDNLVFDINTTVRRGELFQTILDEIIDIVKNTSYPELQQQISEITWRMVETSTKALNLDTNLFRDMISIHIDSPVISINDFRRDDILLEGDACNVLGTISGRGYRAFCMLCGSKDRLKEALLAKETEELVKKLLLQGHIGGNSSSSSSSRNTMNSHQQDQQTVASTTGGGSGGRGWKYSHGGLWVNEMKFIVKGFSCSTTFSLSGNAPSLCTALLNRQGKTAASELTLGVLYNVLCGDRIKDQNSSSTSSGSGSGGSIYDMSDSEEAVLLNSLVAGVSFHARYVEEIPSVPQLHPSHTFSQEKMVHTEKMLEQQLYCRIFIGLGRDKNDKRTTTTSSSFSRKGGATGSTDRNTIGEASGNSNGVAHLDILVEKVLEVQPTTPIAMTGKDKGLRGRERGAVVRTETRKILGMDGLLVLEVEYTRELVSPSTSTSISSEKPRGVVQLQIRARVRDKSISGTSTNIWDVETVLDISQALKLQGGHASVGLIGSGATIIRHPALASTLKERIAVLDLFLGMKAKVKLPTVLAVIFDEESLNGYERLFSNLFKKNQLHHSNSNSHINSSGSSGGSNEAAAAGSYYRLFCQMRHYMLFFISNLYYYLQVDVVDSEFSSLCTEINGSTDLQAVMRSHRNFITTIIRLSMIDNLSVQDGLDRILQICLRFVSLCWYKDKDIDTDKGIDIDTEHSNSHSNSLFESNVLYEELESIQKDFISNTSSLFNMMRKVENRGFMFRLDFNGYLSNLFLKEMGGR
eukprot:gene6225-12613_t